MQMSQFHYLPLTPAFFSLLVVVFLAMLVLWGLMAILGVVRRAYESLGVSPGTAMLLLFGSLIGSYFNIPIAELPDERMMPSQTIDYFGMQYAMPDVGQFAGTVIAVNIGGAVIPTLMSIYLIVTHELWGKGAVATGIVAIVLHWLAEPVPGLGIAVPVFLPAVTRRSSPCCCRARTPRRSPILPAALARSLAPISPISTRSAASARRSLRSAEPAPSTAFFSPAFSPCCWRASMLGRDRRRHSSTAT